MYAGLISGHIQPVRFEEFTETFSRELLPAISREHGFKSLYVMQDASQNKITLLVMWGTEAEAQGSLEGHLYHRLSEIVEFLDGQSNSETLEVIMRA